MIDMKKLTATITAEKAAMEMFVSLGDAEIAAYLTAYPNSMFIDTAFLDSLKKGALHEELHVPEDKPIPAGKERKALHSDDPLERKRARFAETVKHWHHASEITAAAGPTADHLANQKFHVRKADEHGKLADKAWESNDMDTANRHENLHSIHDHLEGLHGAAARHNPTSPEYKAVKKEIKDTHKNFLNPSHKEAKLPIGAGHTFAKEMK